MADDYFTLSKAIIPEVIYLTILKKYLLRLIALFNQVLQLVTLILATNYFNQVMY